MKTLYQKLETELDSGLYMNHGFNETEKEFLRLVKDWLTQKRQQIVDQKRMGGYKADRLIIDELIEEIGAP